MQLKFISLGLIASLLASASARSVYTEDALTQNTIAETLNSHLVARCNDGCCSSGCGSRGSSNGGGMIYN